MNLKTIAAFVSGLFRAARSSPPASTPGHATIGRFAVLRALGRGAQGAVYLARDPDLDRLVAVKIVSEVPGRAADAGGGWPQARNLAQLRHPNIVALYEVGTFEGLTYLVFEYLEGATLGQELKAGALALPAAYGAIMQVVDAMAHAHAKGILHLDLSPNVAAWEKSQPAADAEDAASHGTVAFLLKCIAHRGDFPAVSKMCSAWNAGLPSTPSRQKPLPRRMPAMRGEAGRSVALAP